MRWTARIAGKTDVGQSRVTNEDGFVVVAEPTSDAATVALVAVADGMGGHDHGEVASAVALDRLQADFAATRTSLALERKLGRAVTIANRAVVRAGTEAQGSRMGTTLVALALRDGQAAIANVGDSRAYLWRNGHLAQLTDDHSLVAEHLRAGAITEEQARVARYRNVVTRVLGQGPRVAVDLLCDSVIDGDRFLLCSDGLHGVVEDVDLAAILAANDDDDAAATALVAAANAAGGPDNITAVLVRIRAVPDDDPTSPPVPSGAPRPPVAPPPDPTSRSADALSAAPERPEDGMSAG